MNLVSQGRKGEERAAKLLVELGFTKPDWDDLKGVPDGLAGASDIDVKRWGEKFAINVLENFDAQ